MSRPRSIAALALPLLTLPFSTLALLVLEAPDLRADTDLRALTPVERRIFGSEIRAVLRAHPELVRPRAADPQDFYADDIASDVKLIESHEERLFAPGLPAFGPIDAPQRLAVFVAADCNTCSDALVDLKMLSSRHAIRVFVIDSAQHDVLARAMGVDRLPFYVFPKMMLRGRMPDAVLERYFVNRTGQ